MNPVFIGAASLLLVLTLAWLLRPLLRGSAPADARETASDATRRALNIAIARDQIAELEKDRVSGDLSVDDCEQAREELQQRLLQDAAAEPRAPLPAAPAANGRRPARRSALALALLLPLGAALLYLWLGNPAALQPPAPMQRFSAEQIDAMVAGLAARLEKNPDDAQGWAMLARSYKALRRFDEAGKAFAKAGVLLDKDADLLTEYADLLATQSGGNLEGRPLALVKRALQLDPQNPMALALAGTAAYNRGDYAETRRHWDELLKILPPDSEDAHALTRALDEARQKAEAATPQKHK